MKFKKESILAAIACAMLLAGAAWGMNHDKQEGQHGQHGQHDQPGGAGMTGMDHGGGDTVMLGEDVQDGIKAMFHLTPIDPAHMPEGFRATHHLMVMFDGTAAGQPVGDGTVAVKVRAPDGQESEALKMMPMQGEFGADVVLDQPGTWTFQVATKFADKVRRFTSSHTVR